MICRHCHRPIAPSSWDPDVWCHTRNGRPTTTHCTEGSGIRQAEPVETDDEIAERPW